MKRPEQQIQKAVFQHFTARRAPGVFAFHPANGGWRSKIEASIMKGLGVVPGVPDVIAIKEGQVYALELKAKNGKYSDKQKQVAHEMYMAGVIVGLAYGLDDALEQLEVWGLLRGTA